MARETLAQALEKGRIDESLYWQNDDDASGYAAGGVTMIAIRRADEGEPCRKVLIETAMARQPSHQRVRTYCRVGAGWTVSASTRE